MRPRSRVRAPHPRRCRPRGRRIPCDRLTRPRWLWVCERTSASERVLAAAAKLRYRPNTLARGIRSGSTRTLGLVVSDIQLSFFSQVVRAIADTAHEAGFEVILTNTDEDLMAERAAVGVLVDKRVDGMLVAPADPTHTAHLQEVQERGIPVVLFDRDAPGCGATWSWSTTPARRATAVRHLVRLGHTRVAIVVEGQARPAGGRAGQRRA